VYKPLFKGFIKCYHNGRIVKARASCSGDLEFISRTGQARHGFANGAPERQHLQKKGCAAFCREMSS